MSRICKPLRIGSKLQCVKKYIANATIAKTFDLIESLFPAFPEMGKLFFEADTRGAAVTGPDETGMD